MAAHRTFDVIGNDLEQGIAGVVAKAVVDAFEVVDVEKHHREHAAFGGFLAELLGKDLIEAAAVDQVGQGVVVGHLLQRHARLIKLAEQGVDPAQVVFLVLQFLVEQRRADRAAQNQQDDQRDRQAQLQLAGIDGRRGQAAFGQHQLQGCHSREMHAENARAEYQRRAVFEQLMSHATAFAQVTGYPQRGETGADGDRDRQRKQGRFVVRSGARLHGGHTHVMHAGDAEADEQCGFQVEHQAWLRMAQRVHRQPRGEQGDQQGKQGDRQVVLDFNRRLKGEHADEMHGPDAAGQAGGAYPAPQSLGTRVVGVGNPLGHIEGGKTRSASNQIGHQHQQGIMCAIKNDLPALRQLGNELQTKPLHSTPRL